MQQCNSVDYGYNIITKKTQHRDGFVRNELVQPWSTRNKGSSNDHGPPCSALHSISFMWYEGLLIWISRSSNINNHNYREILSTTCIKCINHLTSSMQMYARKFYQWHISIVEPISSSHYTTSRSPHKTARLLVMNRFLKQVKVTSEVWTKDLCFTVAGCG